MRFDEFVAQHHVEVLPTDRFVGFAVGVELPADWTPADAPDGMRVWVWPNDPRKADFCANAVLNMYRVESVMDPDELFGMLCEQQRQSVPECREVDRGLSAATEGPGVTGTLILRIDHPAGAIDSATRSRIVTAERETLVAQLTVTAMHDSPLDRTQLGLSLVVDSSSTGPDKRR